MLTLPTLTLGIDYSMTCPAITIYDGNPAEFSFTRCFTYYRSDRKPIQWRNITGSSLDDKLNMVNEERWDLLADWVMECLRKHWGFEAGVDFMTMQPAKAYIEDYSFGSAGRSFHLAENAGMAKHKLWKAGVDIIPVSPSVIKKYGTGKGNAIKDQMYAAFYRETNLNLMAVFQPKAESVGSPVGDIVDSYYICKYGVQVGGRGNLEPKPKKPKKLKKIPAGTPIGG